MTKEERGAIRNAAKALSDLNTFAIVVSILEGGHIHAPSHAGAARIMKICRAEQQRCLLEYDKQMDIAGVPLP